MKIYILQKDLPDILAGAELVGVVKNSVDAYQFFINGECIGNTYSKHVVENDNGTWFKLKEDEKQKYTEEDMRRCYAFAHQRGRFIGEDISTDPEKFKLFLKQLMQY